MIDVGTDNENLLKDPLCEYLFFVTIYGSC